MLANLVGLRNKVKSYPFSYPLIISIYKYAWLARLAGFEPATHGLEVRCSVP